MCLHAVCGFLVTWFYASFPELLLHLSHYLTSPNDFLNDMDIVGVGLCVCVSTVKDFWGCVTPDKLSYLKFLCFNGLLNHLFGHFLSCGILIFVVVPTLAISSDFILKINSQAACPVFLV